MQEKQKTHSLDNLDNALVGLVLGHLATLEDVDHNKLDVFLTKRRFSQVEYLAVHHAFLRRYSADCPLTKRAKWLQEAHKCLEEATLNYPLIM